jgi:hypothetical protein
MAPSPKSTPDRRVCTGARGRTRCGGKGTEQPPVLASSLCPVVPGQRRPCRSAPLVDFPGLSAPAGISALRQARVFMSATVCGGLLTALNCHRRGVLEQSCLQVRLTGGMAMNSATRPWCPAARPMWQSMTNSTGLQALSDGVPQADAYCDLVTLATASIRGGESHYVVGLRTARDVGPYRRLTIRGSLGVTSGPGTGGVRGGGGGGGDDLTRCCQPCSGGEGS